VTHFRPHHFTIHSTVSFTLKMEAVCSTDVWEHSATTWCRNTQEVLSIVGYQKMKMEVNT